MLVRLTVALNCSVCLCLPVRAASPTGTAQPQDQADILESARQDAESETLDQANRQRHPDWATLFSADDLRRILPQNLRRAVVIWAGAKVSQGAAAALLEGLNQLPSMVLAIDDSELRIDRTAANVEIAEQALETRAELIFIVRVHQRRTGAIAVIRGFNRIGEQAISLIADIDNGLVVEDGSSRYFAPQDHDWDQVGDTTHQAVDDERMRRRPTAYPVSPSLAPIKSQVAAPPKVDNSPESAYGRSFIHFLGPSDQLMLMVDVRDAGSAAEPHLGLERRKLEGRSFYDQIDRPDLRKLWFRRKVSRLSLLIGGLGVGVLGTTVAGAAAQKLQDCVVGCTRQRRRVAVFAPLAIVGFGVMLVGMFLKKHPISLRERRQLATAYNDRLQRSLNLQLETVEGLENTPAKLSR